MSSKPQISKHPRSASLRDIARETLDAIKEGSYTIPNAPSVSFDLEAKVVDSKRRTRYHPPDSSLLKEWHTKPVSTSSLSSATEITFIEISTLEGARYLRAKSTEKIGVLNFASAKKAGGGFINGASAQEESIARSSTLYPTLLTKEAERFYALHKRDPKDGYYSHAMIYSPDIVLFRDDAGGWLEPLEVDILTSPAVNAGVVRQTVRARVAANAEEELIQKVMTERMARILRLFEQEGVKNLVLGSFGTGVFKNRVATVGRIWADLLGVEGSRFEHSFERVVFAVLGKKTFEELQTAFERRQQEVYKRIQLAP
ncbi:hypothetical protein PLEOSDRAFT_1041962 [Pleurotus ostreatus PC15]|uniref:Microbial-type PARG catalytic domain-containing protein n=1 Tax=Pleurotus ostreatus (strain PC15) TaxID=1137138 RepID=A0A067NXF9_PLEO1|nr:hypothetical protein PLEOSDRAFT_1041962 [Pleurotus ostreatus PC15]